ncbi:efflux RND transporter periplasmic adaptor subunit [Fundidesulfovibrio terrae]|uniref:efflux RND transporter periplasmic adaptor subunit n=1 Tax=Fundidesulfovibrio terrae TaxID=2922866 RepID=UPI001FAE8376|nr:efflux RND transporter periplasmic adaptor subunit [Fundidesulfovibrio terrae]
MGKNASARVVPLLLCTLCLGSSPGCSEEKAFPPPRPVVKTVRVALAAESDSRTYPGVIVARHEVDESFRVSGRIERRLVDKGDLVRQGQKLAVLDEKDFRLSLESAQAELKAASSNVSQASAEEKRYTYLLSRHVVSQSEYDLKRLQSDEAKARLEKADRAFKLARNQLSYASLTSNDDGVVTKVNAERGQVVTQGQAVVAVAQDGALEVQADIPEGCLRDIENSDAEVSLWSQSDTRYKAVLRETSPCADPATRTYAVRFTLVDGDQRARLGMSATLRLSRKTSDKLVRIPSTALLEQGKGPGVWVVEPDTGKLSLRPVVIARYADRDVLVQGRLAEGETIVATGVQMLDPGMSVRLDESNKVVER